MTFESFDSGHCTWFWDRLCGLDIGLYCYDHDAAYFGDYALKLRADYILAASIWKASGRSNCSALVKAISVASYLLTSTIGNFFWIKTQILET